MMTKSLKYGLSERSVEMLWAIFSKYPDIQEIRLFGSRAKGNYHQGSDIDLAIMNQGLYPKTIQQVLSDCEDSNLPYRVDLIDFNTLKNLELKKHIERVGVLFYSIGH